jgi:hypothetical protein
MKKFLILLSLFAAAAALAQKRSPENAVHGQAEKRATNSFLLEKQEDRNQIRGKKAAYSGIAAQVVKAGNPAQLINPLAPPEYGPGEDNLVRDPLTGRARGLKIFSVQF